MITTPRPAVTTDRHPVMLPGEPVTVIAEENGGYVHILDSLYGEEIWARPDAIRFVDDATRAAILANEQAQRDAHDREAAGTACGNRYPCLMFTCTMPADHDGDHEDHLRDAPNTVAWEK